MSQRAQYCDQNADITKSKVRSYYSTILTEAQIKQYDEFFSIQLPSAFRLNQHHKSQIYLQSADNLLNEYFNKRLANKALMQKIPHIGYGYQFVPSRTELKANNDLNKIHKFLVLCNESGLLTRQELVSMLPPLFLQCQKNESVLDLCAAPGSKTSQLLEQVGLNGLVVANDLELQRCHVLLHGVISQPTPQLVLTNLDATRYPSLKTFDKVLADVPCTGDGTIRKAREIVTKWSPWDGITLHEVQLKILLRGLQLLKKGGFICYSTCSLNPVENEAVVQAALHLCGKSIELVDCSKQFTQIKRAEGLIKWNVPSKDLSKYYTTHKEAQESITNEKERSKYVNSLFSADCKELTKCMRFYPWMNNSGGFFVAIIKKVQELPENETLSGIDNAAIQYLQQNTRENYSCAQNRQLPLHPQRQMKNKEVIEDIQKKYQFKQFFEENDLQEIYDNLSQRELIDVQATRIYCMNKNAAEILYSSEKAFERYHIVQAGCPIFERQTGIKYNNQLNYRVESLMQFVLQNTKFCITISLDMFKFLIKQSINDENNIESVTFDTLSDINENFAEECINLRKTNSQQLNLLQIKNDNLDDQQKQQCKKKARHMIHCLLNNEDIEQIIVTGEAKRKAAYKERRRERDNQNQNNKGSEQPNKDNADE